MLKNWLKIYFSVIQQAKLFFVWNIVGLAIGIASVLVAISYLKSEYSYNSWLPNNEAVYELNLEMGKQANSIVIPAGVGPYLLADNLIDSYCYFALEYLDFYAESKTKQGLVHKILNTQKTFFEFFPFEMKYGNTHTVLDKELSIAISDQLATVYFGENHNPVGDTLSLAHQKYVVSGVYIIKDKSTIMPDVVLANMEWNTVDHGDLWQENLGGLLIKKHNNVSEHQLSAALTAAYYTKKKKNKYFEEQGEDIKVQFINLHDGRFESRQTTLLEGRTKIETLLLIVGSSFLIFILAVLNYVSLSQASVLTRIKEFNIRRIIGATKAQLIMQLLFETLLNTLIALSIALVFVELSLPVYNTFLQQSLRFQWSELWYIVLVIISVIVLIGGLLPALYASYVVNRNMTNKQAVSKVKTAKIKMFFVGIQLIIAFFFLITGWIVYNQVDFMQSQNVGFKGDNVYQVKLYSQQIRRKFYRNSKLINAIKQLEGVQNIALSTISFKNKTINTNYTAYYNQQKINDFIIEGIDDEYVALMGFEPISEKTNIEVDIPTAIVTSKFVAKMNKSPQEVLGDVLSFDGNTFIIKAVIGDFYRDGFEEAIKPMIMLHWNEVDFLPYNIESVSIQIDPTKREETMEKLHSFWIVNVDYEYPFEPILVQEQFEQMYQKTLSQRNMFMLWNIAVVAIALFGLYAVLSFVIEQRLKEVVIRKILGASTVELMIQLAKPFIIALLIAYLLVIYPTYWLLEQWTAKFVYRCEIAYYPFVLSFFIVLGIVSIVLYTKVRNATKVNIAGIIKYD